MTTRKLPDGIVKGDLKYPRKLHRDPYGQSSDPFNGYFELWYTERFGWVIPTLIIGGRGGGRRTYAVVVSSGQVCCVGHGPHVLEQVRVYVSHARRAKLMKFVDLWRKGLGDAGTIRDRISTRRANTIMRRGFLGM